MSGTLIKPPKTERPGTIISWSLASYCPGDAPEVKLKARRRTGQRLLASYYRMLTYCTWSLTLSELLVSIQRGCARHQTNSVHQERRGRHDGLFKNLNVFRGIDGIGQAGRHVIFGTCARRRGQRNLYVPTRVPLGVGAGTVGGRSTTVLATLGNLNPTEVKESSRLRRLRLSWVYQWCEMHM
jgi:hypothetical protein